MTNIAVSFQKLRMEFRRPGRPPVVALDSLDLEVVRGQILGLLGPNGSGKTTSVNLLCGLLRPTSGTVVCEGIDVRSDVTGVRSRLGVVPQETALYDDLTADENLSFHARLYGVPRAKRKARIDELLDLVGLSGRRGDRVGTYSGGMQRRLALARALLTRPTVVVLDEPTLGVDVQSRAALWERVRQIADEGGTVLLTTNYMEEAQALADQLAVLDHGELVVTGLPRNCAGRSARRSSTSAPPIPRAKPVCEPCRGSAKSLGATGSRRSPRTAVRRPSVESWTGSPTTTRTPCSPECDAPTSTTSSWP